MRRRTGLLAGALAGALVVGGGLALLWDEDLAGFVSPDLCTATVAGRTVSLDPEQAEHAGLITAIAVARDLPARAASIALATAYQESDLRNLEGGDRDSLGLFQQRPSQGWGEPEQILDPVFATNAFYDALVEVEGYQSMEITVAAQAVQRSAFPEAYADHEQDARTLAAALTGNSPRAFSCRIGGEPGQASSGLAGSGLTHRAERVHGAVADLFPDQPLGGFAPEGVSTGHMEGSAHYEGRAIDVFVRPVGPANRTRGWALAHYLVSQAERLEIRTVIFDARIWTAGRLSEEGWRDYVPPDRPGDRATLEHRDHVHVDVYP